MMRLLWVMLFSLPIFAQTQPSDSLILTHRSQGVFVLEPSGLEVLVGFGTVTENTRMRVNHAHQQIDVSFSPNLASTVLPILLHEHDQTYIVDAARVQSPISDGQFLIYFDTVGVFAQSVENSDEIYVVGMIENFQPTLPRIRTGWTVETIIAEHGSHILQVTDPQQQVKTYTTAAQLPRYRDRFAGQDLGNPATFQFLGWSEDLPDLILSMFPQIPRDMELVAPGEQAINMPLLLPFDCEHDWLVSWGFHYGTPQNYYAVDFASAEGVGTTHGLPVRAAQAGTLYLKQFGYDVQYIDVGLAGRILLEDGVTAIEYGHLDAATLRRWDVDELPAFEWVEVGQVQSGEVIGWAGETGYATGAHIHFVVWTYDQSIYRPILGTWREFERGLKIPASSRTDCEQY